MGRIDRDSANEGGFGDEKLLGDADPRPESGSVASYVSPVFGYAREDEGGLDCGRAKRSGRVCHIVRLSGEEEDVGEELDRELWEHDLAVGEPEWLILKRTRNREQKN
jgi:hypothetical protein